MIDVKKIEEVKESIFNKHFLNKNEDVVYIDHIAEPVCLDYQIKKAIELGAKWAINEFLKDLWHPASEEPKEKVPLLYYRKHKFLPFMVDKHSDVYDWNALVYNFDITKWLYIEDLLAKEGGEQ